MTFSPPRAWRGERPNPRPWKLQPIAKYASPRKAMRQPVRFGASRAASLVLVALRLGVAPARRLPAERLRLDRAERRVLARAREAGEEEGRQLLRARARVCPRRRRHPRRAAGKPARAVRPDDLLAAPRLAG
eukprot:CAMPEP_0180058846 /NCGR_PEP_ID=MMETSP0985-20121206/5231_1 /TAXON_ID=483367 /ORGANISM="non described non described, Strain CCMP 2436" /LENGTH=131 /DNA_ID=CAMNT_0021988839 /DNA_START=184 /DNA_END=578 /DNA_ORIENTATION=+